MSKLHVNFNCTTWATYVEKVLMPAVNPSAHQAVLVVLSFCCQHFYKTKVSDWETWITGGWYDNSSHHLQIPVSVKCQLISHVLNMNAHIAWYAIKVPIGHYFTVSALDIFFHNRGPRGLGRGEEKGEINKKDSNFKKYRRNDTCTKSSLSIPLLIDIRVAAIYWLL